MTDVDKPPKQEAEKCPWYLLATLYGFDEREKNRVAWNRFMATRLNGEQRAAVMESKSFPEEELSPFIPSEMVEIEAAFVARGGGAASFQQLTDPSSQIDFSNLELDAHSRFDGFLFSGTADFSGSTFTGPDASFNNSTFQDAIFDDATFPEVARFNHATFQRASFERATFDTVFSVGATFEQAIFDDATFTSAAFNNATFKVALFENVTFQNASFYNAKFLRLVLFETATFQNATFDDATFQRASFLSASFRDATFNNATFHNVIFDQATFAGETRFINSDMQGPTSFEGAIFKAEPPRFFGAKLHQGTNWRHVDWPVRPRNAEIAAKFVSAYEPLKLEMDRLKKHEDELDFFALEMQAREVMYGWQGTPALVAEVQRWLKTPGGWLKTAVRTVVAEVRRWLKTARMFFEGAAIALYGTLCDYGRSYLTPIIWLLGTIGVGALLFRQHFGFFHKALGFSFVNTFALLGLRKDFFAPSVLESLSNWLRVVAGLQTILGIVFLFLFGLALRNRFRMR